MKRGVVAFALGFVLGAKGLRWAERLFYWALILLALTRHAIFLWVQQTPTNILGPIGALGAGGLLMLGFSAMIFHDVYSSK